MDTPQRAPGDTIAAIATAAGRGGIGVVRVSGPAAADIAKTVCGTVPPPRHAIHREFLDADGTPIDSGLVLHFPGPRSFTGEDVCEFHGHGGPVVLDLLLARVLACGARQAQPGEFSERAFLNGKIDLAQAEAIADLIDSASAQAARGAARSLRGEFSRQVDGLLRELTELRMFVEACIDFPEEEVDFLAESDVRERLQALLDRIEGVRGSARTGALLREGMTVVLAGKPNAGKSSLLNLLAGHDAAIVSAIPGTTRDLLREEILLDGMPLHLVDTAGLRESADEIEREGMRRTLREAGRADRLLLVVDGSVAEDPERLLHDHFPPSAGEWPAVSIVLNKSDLSGIAPGLQPGSDPPRVALSARTGAGLDALLEHLKHCVGHHAPDAGTFSARRRHLDAIDATASALDAGLRVLREQQAAELLAEHLRDAQEALGQITGRVTPDELLGRIFASFCIGK